MPIRPNSWPLRGAVLLLFLLFPALLRAQTDVIRGQVTDADGRPLGGVRVTATSIPGNVTRETRTNARGQFQMAFPGAVGDYMMGFALVGFNFRQFEVKRTADQDVLIANARLGAVQLDTVSVVAPVQQRVSRNGSTPDVSGTERQLSTSGLPAELQGNIAALAASLPGVTLIPGVDGAADGFSVLGLGADQNSVTLNGVQFDGNGLPRDASLGASMTTSPYDPSRGGFSGAQLNVRAGSGSNFRSRGTSLVMNAPQLQWTDRAAQALGTEFTNVSLGGVASGPIVQNKSFYNTSIQLGRQSNPLATLLSTEAVGLQTAGVSPDSVARFLGILDGRGIPRIAGPSRRERVSDNGSFLGAFDFQPPNSTSGSAYGVSVNGNWGRQSPVGSGATSLLAASGDRINWSGGAQAKHNAYVGLILTETNAGFSVSSNYGDAYVDLPAGRVRVNSDLANGASGVQSLTFGGNQGLAARSRSLNASFQNTLSWFDDANKHRVKLSTEVQYSGSEQTLANNLRGTFQFNSLADLEAGRPASYTRQLTTRERNTGRYTLAVSLGDSYRRSQDLQFQYGVRLEGNRFGQMPQYNPEVERLFGIRNDRVPNPIVVSPRFGFSYTLGESNEIGAFSGAVRGPRAVIRGGIGLFANASGAGQIGAALDNTGLPSGAQQLVCIGEAAPTPEWSRYNGDPGSVPDRCADGSSGTVFSNSTPNVTVFGRGFAPQRSLRSNFSWSGALLDARFNASIEATYALNLNQQQSVDINFRPVVGFTLPSEGGRPVFVAPTSIASSTGAIAWGESRVTNAFARVTELRSDLRSQSRQLSVRISPITRGARRFNWNAAYTYTGLREQVSGFSSTAGNPLAVEWATGGQGPHQLSYGLRLDLFNYVQVNWQGQFRSGSRYTPVVGGDINGDGSGNDRAFVFDPQGTTDPALAASMRQLLASTSPAARACLERQFGRVAARNSCSGPWSSTASLNFSLNRAKFRMPQRTSMSFSLSNPLGAADLALHGSGRLRGWGQNPFPDQALVYVRGFDAAAKRFNYEVNQRFGATRPQFLTLRAPVTLTVSMRVDLGPTREQQNLRQQLEGARNSTFSSSSGQESQFRSFGASSMPNPMLGIIRAQDSLQLTALQADSIAVMNRRYAYRVDSLWTPTARQLARLPKKFSEAEAYGLYLRARHAQVDLLVDAVRAINALLTPAQRRKLPSSVTNFLDPRFIESMRNGSGMYVTPGEYGR